MFVVPYVRTHRAQDMCLTAVTLVAFSALVHSMHMVAAAMYLCSRHLDWHTAGGGRVGLTAHYNWPCTAGFRSNSSVTFPLYATRNEVGRYTREPGMRRVGYVKLDLSPGWSKGLASADDYKLKVGMT